MILLWDSADMTVRFTLITDNDRYEYEWLAGHELARDMLGYLRGCLAEHNASFTDLDAIGVFRGPGSYTGLRIGLTVLNTLASAMRIPIVGSAGDEWRKDILARLANCENDVVVLPEYGREAHITAPKK